MNPFLKFKPRQWYLVALIALAAITLLGIACGIPEMKILGGSALLATVPGTIIMDPELQAKVAAGVQKIGDDVKAVKTKQDELVQNYDQLDKSTKKVFEDITALKRTANDSDADFKKMLRKMDEIDARLRAEVRNAYGDPARRISSNEDLRLRLNAVVRLAVNNSSGDMRSLVKNKFPSEFVTKALGEDTSPGSTLINNALANEIYDTLATYGVWNTFAVRRVGTATTKFPVKTARVAAGYILTEGGSISDDSTKAGTSVNCTVEVIAALLNVSMQLLEDAETDITGDILNDFAEAYSYVMDWSCLQANGDADATDGGMTGIFGGGGTASVAASGNVSVETLDMEDFQKCLYTVDAGCLSRPCRWWVHPQILVRALSVKDGNGRPIFLTATEAPTAGGIGSILGYPVTPCYAAPSANTTSSKVAVFGDPNAQVVGVRTDFKFEASDQHRWNTYERSFRGVGRSGNKIRKAGGFAVLTNAAS